jgi:hypothetical protein
MKNVMVAPILAFVKNAILKYYSLLKIEISHQIVSVKMDFFKVLFPIQEVSV